MAGLWNFDLEGQTTNPLFLGGAALISGEGMGGAMRGMQVGGQFQEQRRKRAEEEAQKAQWAQYTQGGMGGLTPEMQALIKAVGPQQGAQVASQYMMKQPELAMEREKLNAQVPLMQAQAAAARAQATNTGQSDDIREFSFAQRNGYNGTFTDWMKQKRDMGNNAAQQITWGRDASGNPVAMQATRGGELIQSKLPPNVTPVPVPEMAFAKAEASKRGEAAGQAQVDLPAVRASARLMREKLDAVEEAIKQNPRMVGSVTGILPNVTGSARDTQAKIDQVQGGVFLQAYQGLRGGGAITEAEGTKAEAALSRLRTAAVGTPAYFAAINDVRKEIAALEELAVRKAQAAGPRPLGGQTSADPLGLR